MYCLVLIPGGCAAYGHSCYGGHGKRFAPDPQDDRFKSVEVDPGHSNDVVRYRGDDLTRQQVEDFVATRNRALELSRRTRDERKYMPILVKEWVRSIKKKSCHFRFDNLMFNSGLFLICFFSSHLIAYLTTPTRKEMKNKKVH